MAVQTLGSTSVTPFAHLNAEKSALYRAILGVFVSERARFTIALRPPRSPPASPSAMRPIPSRRCLHLAFQALVTRFEELTSRAQSFMRNLQSTVELHGTELEAFLSVVFGVECCHQVIHTASW